VWILLTRMTRPTPATASTEIGPIHLNMSHAIAMERLVDEEVTRIDFPGERGEGNAEGFWLDSVSYYVAETPDTIFAQP
jgi:hypothetical protein